MNSPVKLSPSEIGSRLLRAYGVAKERDPVTDTGSPLRSLTPEKSGGMSVHGTGVGIGVANMELESFSGGTSGGSLYPKQLVGHLLLVWAIDYIPHSPTQYSRPDRPSDVIVVDVVDLDTGEIGVQSWWRPSRLIRDLKSKLGKKNPILVAMGMGIGTQGGKDPYEMTPMEANPQAVARANAWFQANPNFSPSSPMPQAPPQPAQDRGTGPQPTNPPDWARPLAPQPGQPAWMPAEQYWPPAQGVPPVQFPATPQRPLTQAERMATQEREQYGY